MSFLSSQYKVRLKTDNNGAVWAKALANPATNILLQNQNKFDLFSLREVKGKDWTGDSVLNDVMKWVFSSQANEY